MAERGTPVHWVFGYQFVEGGVDVAADHLGLPLQGLLEVLVQIQHHVGVWDGAVGRPLVR